jgi:hypothetical protein
MAASGGKSSNVRAQLVWVKVDGIAAETKIVMGD